MRLPWRGVSFSEGASEVSHDPHHPFREPLDSPRLRKPSSQQGGRVGLGTRTHSGKYRNNLFLHKLAFHPQTTRELLRASAHDEK